MNSKFALIAIGIGVAAGLTLIFLFSMGYILPLLLILGILAVVAYVVFPDKVKSLFGQAANAPHNTPRQQMPSAQAPRAPQSNMAATISELQTEISKLQGVNKALMQRLEAVEQRCDKLQKYIETRFGQLTMQQNAFKVEIKEQIDGMRSEVPSADMVTEVAPEPKPEPKPQPEPEPEPVRQASPTKLYAKYLDSECGGFRCDALEADESGAIFEITILSPSEATYQIVPNKVIRTQLFSMMGNVVQPACDIHSKSNDAESIVDLAPGQLTKDGDCWIIKSKAIIKLI